MVWRLASADRAHILRLALRINHLLGVFMPFTRSIITAAAALVLSAGASAQTTSVFGLTSGSIFDAYNFTVAGPSTVVGETLSSGISWFGVLLQSPGVPYTALDTNPDDGFSFSGLTAGTYALTFLGVGTGGYGGYYTVTTTPVPEPETYAMLLAGLGALGLMASRRRKQD
jgi:hypothetical protein